MKWLSTRTESELADAAWATFRSHFAAEPAGVWAAPGRVNLIGEHVDYAGGVCIPFALEQNTAVAVAPRRDDLVRMVSGADSAAVSLSEVGPGHPANWSGYLAGTIWAAGIRTGFDIAVVSDVPIGSGLSSSAALECAVGVAAAELAGVSPDLVAACMRAENEVVGASTGGLDQNASLYGSRGNALVLDCDADTVTTVPFALAERDMVVLIADTNAPHQLADGQYASRRGVIDAVQHAFGMNLRALARTGHPVAKAHQWARENGQDPELVAKRIAHVVEETQRTLRAAEALRTGDFDLLRILMRESHLSLRDQLEVTTPELDSAFEAAGEYGARMTGGGFGGAVIALISRELVPATATAIASAAHERGFPEPTFLVASPGAGARRLR